MKRLVSSKTLSRWPCSLGLIAMLIILLAVVYLLLLRLPTRVYEATDFLGYWSAAHMLAQRQNPYQPEALLTVQREQGWSGLEPHYSWSPPWLYLLLLPFGLMPFREAAALWFVLNPLLMGASALLMWHAVSKRRGLRQLGVALLATFLFSRSLHTVLLGQINTLVLLSCAGFLALAARRRDLPAGALLVVVTVKPVAYLLLPTLLWISLLRGRWRIIMGFFGCLMILILLVTWMFPSWPEAYLSLFEFPASPQNYPVHRPPTIRGFLLAHSSFDMGVWPAVACLTAFLVFMPLRGHSFDLPAITSLSFIVGLPTAPFGWSTDQILLLLPVLQIIAWMPRMELVEKRMVMLSLILIYSYALLVWLVSYQDMAFLVLPPTIGLLWWYARWKAFGSRRTISTAAGESKDAAP